MNTAARTRAHVHGRMHPMRTNNTYVTHFAVAFLPPWNLFFPSLVRRKLRAKAYFVLSFIFIEKICD